MILAYFNRGHEQHIAAGSGQARGIRRRICFALTAEAGDKLQEQTTYLNKPENRDTLRWWLLTGKAKKLLVEKAKAD